MQPDEETTPPVSRTEHDWGTVDPSTAVVEAVAAAAGCDPLSLEPVTEHVDPDALDRFARSADEGAHLNFQYADYCVTVWTGGTIHVQRASSQESR